MSVGHLDELLKPPTLQSHVKVYLREAIVSGRFKPGERLIERELCAHMKISRPSLREALRGLEAERLIQNIPHRGPVVTTVTIQEARDLYVLRALLEGFAAREFARLASDEAIAELTQRVVDLEQSAKSLEASDLVNAKKNFYDVLFTHCGNSLIQRTFEGEMQRISMLRATSLARPDRIQESLKEIRSLLNAICLRDSELASQIAHDHVKKAERVALEVLQAQQGSNLTTMEKE